jgi:hypothetical protein
MKIKLYLLIIFICLIQAFSCKKDGRPAQQQVQSLETGIVNFSINGQVMASNIDTLQNIITVTIADSLNEHALTANFTLSGPLNATANNTAVNSSFVYDFSKPVNFAVTSADKKRSTTFKVIVQTELQYYGVAGNVIAANSLNKSYNFYYDQFDGSTYQAINCGPTVSTMAIKWADPTFTKKPVDARIAIPEDGGWWLTSDIQNYLSTNGINNSIDTLSNLDSLVKKNIDNNNLMVLCLDMFYVSRDMVDYHHIQKFYQANTIGWGHFLLVKGYRQTDAGAFYLEIYDPYSDKQAYIGLDNGELKGQDRYYQDIDIIEATNKWWPYAIITASKGQKVTASSRLALNSIGKPKAIPVANGQ